VERLVEETMARVGGLQFIDAAHADFSDGSDAKTASIRVNSTKVGSNSHVGEITGVQTSGSGLKSGALRCVIYNPHSDRLMYYFLPWHFWTQHITRHPSSGIGKIMYCYNAKTQSIVKFQDHQLSSFKALAQAV
jgi:hypothetical protein